MLPSSSNAENIEDLYLQHSGFVRAWLMRRLGNLHQADDLTQDTYLRLITRKCPCQADNPMALLTTIAKRVLTDHWRREALEKAYLQELAMAPQMQVDSPEELYIVVETLLQVDRLLNGLPNVVRHVFLLNQIDGLKHSEIALEMGLSVSTVKRHLASAAMRCLVARQGFEW